jgi:hypothetical protein
MDPASLWTSAQPYVEPLAIWRGYERDLQSLLIYAVGIALYTALVFAFYQNISRRDAFVFERKKGGWGRVLTVAQTGLLFPLMSFLYFGVLAVSLFVLAKSQGTTQILLLSMSVVVGVRVTAFASEMASVDLAKMLPLALLGVLIVDPTYLSLDTTWARLADVPGLWPLFVRFFVLFIVLEGALRLLHMGAHRIVTRLRRPKRATFVKEYDGDPGIGITAPTVSGRVR